MTDFRKQTSNKYNKYKKYLEIRILTKKTNKLTSAPNQLINGLV